MATDENTQAYDERPWLKWYDQYGVSDSLEDWKHSNLVELIRSASNEFANDTAFTVCLDNGITGSLTFREVDDLSDQFAAYLLHNLKLSPGDRVGVQLPNCLSFPIAAFGALKAGCTLVNINPLYTAPEMIHQINDSGAKLLIIIDLFADKLPEVVEKTQLSTILLASVADYFPFFSGTLVKTVLKLKKQVPAVTVPAGYLKDAVKSGSHRLSVYNADRPQLNPDDIAVLQYTGGTTGVSKGAALSHKNLTQNIGQVTGAASCQLERNNTTTMTALPLYHIFAFTVNMFYTYSIGGHNILIPSPRPINKLKKPFEKFDINLFTGLNILFNALLHEKWFTDNPPQNMKVVLAGGAALHESVSDLWSKHVSQDIREGYGLTESSPVLSVNPVRGKAKIHSVGLPLPQTFVRIVDDEGNCVPMGEQGEIIAKGPQIMTGYWQRPDETENTIKDGWLYTGDIGKFDEDGYLFIVDRKKDMILVSGFNVFPNEVEDAISQHPDVIEVAVIGIPDENCGEAVKAFVVSSNPNLTLDELRTHCKERLTNYKLPKHLELRDDLPKSPIGKILRKDLRPKSD